MSGFMLHGLGDCAPERHCGCLDIPAMTAPEPTRPTAEHIDAVARAISTREWGAEAAEAEVGTLRAQVAAVEALVNNGQTVGWIERDGDAAWIAADAIRAALATTGEGQ